MQNSEYLKFTKNIAKQAGIYIREGFNRPLPVDWKGDNSPVTEIDLKVNNLVIEEVQKNFPGHSILGEEESVLIEGSKYTWVCDPIDGTIPFMRKIPTSVFSLTLVEDGRPIVACLYDPYVDRLVMAEKGRGCFVNDEKCKVASHGEPARDVINLSTFPSKYIDTPATFKNCFEKGFRLAEYCSQSYAGMLVAIGKNAAVIFTGSKAHDAAAMSLLIEEAGGVQSDLFFNDQRYDGTVKGLIAGHSATVAVLKDCLVYR